MRGPAAVRETTIAVGAGPPSWPSTEGADRATGAAEDPLRQSTIACMTAFWKSARSGPPGVCTIRTAVRSSFGSTQ